MNLKKSKEEKISINPLSVLLGAYLAKERNLLRMNSKDMANQIGIGESFYRMIEAGLANLHPSRVLDFIKSFPNSQINFDAICKFLVAVQMVENNLSSYDQLKKVIDEMSAADFKLQKLFAVMEPVWNELKKGNEEIKPLIESEVFLNELQDFLTRYELYAVNPKESSETVVQNANNIFRTIPTIYFDFVEDIVTRTQELPVRIRFSDLWKWEERNSSKFKEHYGIFRDHSSITNYENLRKYKYLYLWQGQHIATYFIFLNTDVSAEKIKSVFEKNLRRSLTEGDYTNELQTFDEKMKKIRFKCCPPDHTEIIDLLTGSYFDDSENPYDKVHDAFWVFRLVNGNNIGFLASIEKETYKPFEGINLGFDDTVNKLDGMKKLWDAL